MSADELGPPEDRRRRWPWVLLGMVAAVVVTVAAFAWWATSTPEPGARSRAALESDDRVLVVDDDGYTFQPAEPADVGFVLYPGARVDPASYAVAARDIAEEGFLVVVPELTLNLAVLDASVAADVIAANPDVDRWVVGGHSLGGAMAAGFAEEHPDDVSGLVLWAAYPPDGVDLSTADLAVASIFGTRDGLTTLADIEDSRRRLRPETEFVAIEGGNHAQFGDYGSQRGDEPATITFEEQQEQIVEATLRVLRSL